MRRPAAAFTMTVIAAALCAGCRDDPAPPERGDQLELLLFSGAGLQPPVEELLSDFTAAEGVTVTVDYAGSEVLFSKIKVGARGDLYLPGDRRYVDTAEDAGLVASRTSVCWFVPTILVQTGNPKAIRGLGDLLRPEVRLGLGDPRACAIGRISRELLQKNGVAWEAVKPSVRFQSVTVNELAVHVRTGSLDAAIVWDAVAHQYAQHTDTIEIPTESNILSTVDLAVLKTSRHKELAQRFADFVNSPHGRDILRRHGYRVEAPAEAAGGGR